MNKWKKLFLVSKKIIKHGHKFWKLRVIGTLKKG